MRYARIEREGPGSFTTNSYFEWPRHLHPDTLVRRGQACLCVYAKASWESPFLHWCIRSGHEWRGHISQFSCVVDSSVYCVHPLLPKCASCCRLVECSNNKNCKLHHLSLSSMISGKYQRQKRKVQQQNSRRRERSRRQQGRSEVSVDKRDLEITTTCENNYLVEIATQIKHNHNSKKKRDTRGDLRSSYHRRR